MNEDDRVQLPAADRVGGPQWLEATGGKLTWTQKRSMFAISARTQLELMSQKIARRHHVEIDVDDILRLPDTRLVKDAEDAALCQSPALLAHGYRTAYFARALSRIDGVSVDEELLIVTGLLHDAGLVPAVFGEDFTLRSGRIASETARHAGREDVSKCLHDAICVHTTVGVNVEKDGALGAYTQFGAMVDLVGLRERHLSHDLVTRVLKEHPREGFVKEILAGLHGEARAVPGGRFAFLRGVGFSPAMRMASLPSRP